MIKAGSFSRSFVKTTTAKLTSKENSENEKKV
jgi:hypothetical protein